MVQRSFQEYIHFLRENFENLLEYKEQTGTLEKGLKQAYKDLFDEDPFVVFNASLVASEAFLQERIYH